ncbi:MAG: DUF3857 domain-containing protein [Bacteroidales bacterium]|nr:DUF3857 domain-containing protein [Bacteroidales bacterium]
MKYIYTLSLSIIFSLFFSNSFAQINYKDADAVYSKITKEYQLNDDGSINFHYSKNIKLQRYYAINYHYGETMIVYNPEYQKLKINHSYTIMSDGKKIVTPDNAFNEVLPKFASGIAAYNNLREMIITHTGLERNAYINLDYDIITSKDFYPSLMGNELLYEASPVEFLTIKIKIPKDKKINYKTLNILSPPDIVNEKNMKVYSWTFKDIPARPNDALQPYDYNLLPRLLFSIENDSKDVFKKFINQEAFKFITNVDMDNAVDNIVKNNKNSLDVVFGIQKLVAEDIAYKNIPLKYTGFRCRTAEETWKSNAGTKLEKAILFKALLNKANINSDIVAVIPSNYIDKDGKSLSFKNIPANLFTIKDFLLKIKIKGYSPIYLSPLFVDYKDLKYSLYNKTLLILNHNEKKYTVCNDDFDNNEILYDADIILGAKNNIKCISSLKLKNYFNPYFLLNKDKENAKNLISEFSGKDIEYFNINKSDISISNIEFRAEKKDIADTEDDYIFWDLPIFKKGINSWNLSVLPSQRNSAIELPSNISEVYNYSIIISDKSKLITPILKIEKKNDVGKVNIEISKNENNIKILKSIKIFNKIVPLNKYNEFRDLMKVWNNKKYKTLIIKK